MIWLLATAPVIDGMVGHTFPQVPVHNKLVAQAVSDDIHQRCLAASDYSGCIRSNSGAAPANPKRSNQTDQSSNQEKCWRSGVCIAKPGMDQLGLNKVVGWHYFYNASNNVVRYWNIPPKRVPHKGQPDRYVALSFIEHYYQQPIAERPGYYREITPAKTECRPNYLGGTWVNGKYQKNVVGQTCTTSSPTKIWVAGTPGVPGGPRQRSWVTVTDCEDLTYADYINGKLKGKWSKLRNDDRFVCKYRSKLEVSNMKL